MINRIDRVVLTRLATRIGATVFIFYGLIALVESLDTWRFTVVSNERGTHMAVLMVAMSAVRWTIKTLPVTVLMGAILGLVDLKMRHELTVIKTSGISIWRLLRAPVLVLMAASFVIALGAETISTQINRDLAPTPPGQTAQLTPDGEIWLEQRGSGEHYVLMARRMSQGGSLLNDVTLFDLAGGDTPRLEAEEALLQDGYWTFSRALVRSPDGPARAVSNARVPTSSTAAEISLKLASTEDMTFFELAQLLQRGVSDPSVRAATAMRLIKLLALPLVLTGSLLIAFAFTAGYNRRTQFGPAVLYGIVLGFVVFIITEMADRAGSTGVLDPTFAAVGPAVVAIVIGVTVLLRREDGWT
ncbi:lipopolysaccharide export system permease protein [Devosia lucknowensis]|uniref:Lipopolysaccharide export system permease protein n=1 Tax=Devosia lucknowensis TaxID=1096929 RepID=A0A1Y6EIA6_9HYPH|nr:LptF/LptG family permease [Devosia lucknowensis]SMQ62345.1 lipopolysaccharide export system permease protein [Devosia lucknowensis]